MSLATVICECSLNQFSTSLFLSLFVHREPQQIFMGVNKEFRANLVKGWVNVPTTLLHIYWVCQYKLFLISEGWGGRGGGTLLKLQNLHWNIIGVIISDGLVWGQEANPVADKSEYIREGYALRKSPKKLKYKKQKKEN